MYIELKTEKFGGSIGPCQTLEWEENYNWDNLSQEEKEEINRTGKVVLLDTTEYTLEDRGGEKEYVFAGMRITAYNFERFHVVQGQKIRKRIKSFWKEYKLSKNKDLKEVEPEILNCILAGGIPAEYSLREVKKIERKIEKYL